MSDRLFLGWWGGGGDFGLSRLTSLQFIHYHVAGFYKPTIPQSPPFTAHATMPG
jgi:hypothetical protein